MPATPRQRLRAALAPDARKMMLDASVPEAIRRWKWMRILLLTPIVVLLCGPGLLIVYGAKLSPPVSYWIIGNLLLWTTWLLTRQGIRRALRRAAAHDHLLCPDCTYDLRSLDASGACPECGRAYEHDAVRAQWLDAEQRLKRRKT